MMRINSQLSWLNLPHLPILLPPVTVLQLLDTFDLPQLRDLLLLRFLPERDYVTFGSLLSQFRLSSVCRLSVCLSSVCL